MDMAKGRWTRRTWIEAALRAIARDGVAAVSVDGLATELGATRGSFYWHFADRRALLEEAMATWDEIETGRVERAVAAIADPVERMRTNFLQALADVDDPVPGLEPAIYAQPDHPAVAPAVRRVTERRLEILTHGYADLGLEPVTARRQAVLAYATYVGWLQLRRTAADLVPEVAPDGPATRAMVDHVVAQLVPGAGAPPGAAPPS